MIYLQRSLTFFDHQLCKTKYFEDHFDSILYTGIKYKHTHTDKHLYSYAAERALSIIIIIID